MTDRLRRLALAWRLYWVRLELRLTPTERQRLFAVTVLIGGLCGLAAVGFHLAIRLVSALTVDRAVAASGWWRIVGMVAIPTLGALVAGILLLKAPRARGSGIPEVRVAYALRGGRLRLRDALAKMFIGIIQLGTGSSLGREGPTVHLCSSLATAIGRLAGVSPRNLRRLLPVGTAAGVAAAFNAPIAAVTFTVEEIIGQLDQTVLSGVIVAAALAAVVERSILGAHPIFDVPQGHGLDHASSLLLYALLGLSAALASVLFSDSLLFLRRWFRTLDKVPIWVRPAMGGLATGGIAVLAILSLHTEGVLGGGYATLGTALTGGYGIRILGALCLLKIASTAMSYGSGGSGGIFAPSLFVGGMLGGVVGGLDVWLFDHPAGTMASFALVGMGSVFAGVIRAPITSVLIIIEMTGNYALILPLMIANMTAYGLARQLRPTAIYDALLAQDGVHLRESMALEVLDGVPLSEVPLDTRRYTSFVPTAGVKDMLGGRGRQEVFPVLDGQRLVGIITSTDLDILASEPDLDGVVCASDLMRAPVAARTDDDLRTVFDRMLTHGVRELPVVDGNGHIIGFVDEAAIARTYMKQRAPKH